MMDNLGAIPKTPVSSPRKLSQDTPRKTSINVRISPKSKDLWCMLCGYVQPNVKYKFRLFENVLTKTAACRRIEKTLDITVDSIFNKGYVCKKCDRDVTKLSTTEVDCANLRTKLKMNYADASKRYLRTFGQQTSKRLSYTESPEKPQKKQLSDITDKENSCILRRPQFANKNDTNETPSRVWVSYICELFFLL